MVVSKKKVFPSNRSRNLLFSSHNQRAFLQTCTLFLVDAKIPDIWTFFITPPWPRSKIPDMSGKILTYGNPNLIKFLLKTVDLFFKIFSVLIKIIASI